MNSSNDPLESAMLYLQRDLDCKTSAKFYLNREFEPMMKVAFPQYPQVFLSVPIFQIINFAEIVGTEIMCEQLEGNLVMQLNHLREIRPDLFE